MFATELLIKRGISYCVVIILNEGLNYSICPYQDGIFIFLLDQKNEAKKVKTV